MAEVGGKLIEIERREIEPRPVYYFARREPIELRVVAADTVPRTLATKREKWVAHSMPNHPKGFAVFLFDGVE